MKKKSTPKKEQPPLGALYTLPQLSTSNANDWYVWFRWEGHPHPIKIREGINKKKGSERIEFGESLVAARKKWLELGWNPILDPEFKLRNLKSSKDRKNITLNEAIDAGFAEKNQAKKGKATYKCCLEFIKKIALQTGHAYLPINQVDRGHCLDLLASCKEVKNFTNRGYNKHLETLRAIFTECVNKRIMDSNPLLNTIAKTVAESNLYAPFTAQEKEQISKHLNKIHYQLFVAMQVTYHTGIRPKETLALLIRDIDLNEGIITIAPDEERENSKTNKVRRVPINKHLKALFLEMQLHKYPGKYFVFGTHSLTGCRGRKRNANGILAYGAMRDDYFVPNPYQIKRDTMTALWKKVIQNDPVYHPVTGERVETFYLDPKTGKKVKGSYGIGIKKKLYAAKRTGGRDSVRSGIKVGEMKVLYGHSSEKMTQIYTRDAEEMEANESILSKAPSFTSKISVNNTRILSHWPFYPYIWAFSVFKLGNHNTDISQTDFNQQTPYINSLMQDARNRAAPSDTMYIDHNGLCHSINTISNDEVRATIEYLANEYVVKYYANT